MNILAVSMDGSTRKPFARTRKEFHGRANYVFTAWNNADNSDAHTHGALGTITLRPGLTYWTNADPVKVSLSLLGISLGKKGQGPCQVLGQAASGYTSTEKMVPLAITPPSEPLEVLVNMPIVRSSPRRIVGTVRHATRRAKSIAQSELLILSAGELGTPYGRPKGCRKVPSAVVQQGRAKQRSLE